MPTVTIGPQTGEDDHGNTLDGTRDLADWLIEDALTSAEEIRINEEICRMWELDEEPQVPQPCTCGAHAIGVDVHSDWCDRRP